MSAPQLRQARARVITRARALEGALGLWMRAYVKAILEKEIRASRIAKAAGDREMLADLLKLLRGFGVVQIDDAAREFGAGSVSSSGFVTDYMAEKEVMVQGIASNVREQVRGRMRSIIVQQLGKSPQPGAGEIAKTIREYYKGNIYGPAAAGAAKWNDVSNARAALIARTEMVQAVNTGRAAGLEALGVKRIKWLAYTDGRSGDRHHERMHGKIVALGEKFRTPLGNRLRWPGDPQAPIKETANCRCSIGPAED